MSSMLVAKTIEETLVGWTGSLAVAGLLIIAFFFIILLIVGLDFRFSLMFVMPLGVAFSDFGWFPGWVSIMFWILFVGLGVFLVYRAFEGY